MSDQTEIKLHALDYWQVIRNRYGVILLTFFLVFMCAVVIAYLRTSEYLGKVQIEVQRQATDGETFRETGKVGEMDNAALPHMDHQEPPEPDGSDRQAAPGSNLGSHPP